MTLFRSPSRARSRDVLSPDWIWGSLGVTIAGASAGFAGYMIATAPSEVTGTGSKDFNIFVQWDRRSTSPGPNEAKPSGRIAPAPAVAGTAIDPEPTGSIPPVPARTDGQTSAALRAGDLHDFILRDVVGNKALIEHRKTLSLVKAGSLLDEAGRVLSIERRGDAWVVRTTSGIIGGS